MQGLRAGLRGAPRTMTYRDDERLRHQHQQEGNGVLLILLLLWFFRGHGEHDPATCETCARRAARASRKWARQERESRPFSWEPWLAERSEIAKVRARDLLGAATRSVLADRLIYGVASLLVAYVLVVTYYFASR